MRGEGRGRWKGERLVEDWERLDRRERRGKQRNDGKIGWKDKKGKQGKDQQREKKKVEGVGVMVRLDGPRLNNH